MTIRRLRPAHPVERRDEIYAKRYDHTRWQDHVQRVAATKRFINEVRAEVDIRTVADLSCGDAAIATGLDIRREDLVLGDLTFVEGYDFAGPIEETVKLMGDVDLFIMSETVEHLDDPIHVLRDVRRRADYLVLTTPLDEQNDGNEEHYWGWDQEGVETILELSGWWPDRSEIFTPNMPDVYYTYQFWMARRVAP